MPASEHDQGQTSGGVRGLLETFVGHPGVYYLPKAGNGGDALINAGFFDLARTIGLAYRVIDITTDLSSDDVLILTGGASLVPHGRNTAPAIERFAPRVKALVVLPQSIVGFEDLLGTLGPNTYLFAREHVTLEHSLRAAPNAHVQFDHDMAFHTDIEALRAHRGMRGFRPSPGNLVRLAQLQLFKRRAARTRRLRAYRTDREAAMGFKASPANDISKLTRFGSHSEAEWRFSAAQFVQAIDRYDEVETDRLHVAIAASLLGKPTTLHDNSYFKCRAVYEASLKDRGVVMAPAGSAPTAVGITSSPGRRRRPGSAP